MSQKIIKGKLLKGDKVEITYLKQDSLESDPAEVNYKHNAPPLNSFREAFASLKIHAALKGEFIPSLQNLDLKDPSLVKDFNVSGFSMHGEGDSEGVILSAQKILSTGEAMGFNTPIIRFSDESQNAYPHWDDLLECINNCKYEIGQYLSGIRGVKDQPELPFDKDSENGTDANEEEVPVKRKSKAKGVTA